MKNLFLILAACVACVALMAGPVAAQALCTDDCASSGDGECDDGGPNSLYDICEIGSDCADCGVRLCDNSCASANDNECDDGGPDSLYDICALGSDCADCGVR